MTNPLETISPENKDSLERLNDERMHNGLEAVPVEPIEGAHDQRGEEPEAAANDDADVYSPLDELGDIYDKRSIIEECLLPIYEAERWDEFCDYPIVESLANQAMKSLEKALEWLDAGANDITMDYEDALRLTEYETVAECIKALKMYGGNGVMREVITRNLDRLTSAQ